LCITGILKENEVDGQARMKRDELVSAARALNIEITLFISNFALSERSLYLMRSLEHE